MRRGCCALRSTLTASGSQLAAYDVGFYDRHDKSPPYIRANAAGGVAFGFGYDATGAVDPARPNGFVWMTGDGLCSPGGPCFNPATGAHDDASEVHGIEGRDPSLYEAIVPDAAFQPYPAPGPATPPSGPDSAFMVDVDVTVDPARNDATRIGDIAIYQAAPDPAVRPVAGPWYGPCRNPGRGRCLRAPIRRCRHRLPASSGLNSRSKRPHRRNALPAKPAP